MLQKLKNSNLKLWLALKVAAVAFLLSEPLVAASIQKCSAKTSRCVVRMQEGIVGDRVKILDEKAHIVAYGRVIKKKGAYGVIVLKQVIQPVRRGFPVIVQMDSRSSNLQWAASFSDK